MTRRRRRGLTPEEQALWQKVADRTQPLHKPNLRPDPARAVSRDPAPAPAAPAPISPFTIGEKRTDTAIPAGATPPEAVRMDRKAHTRMRRGKLTPEARIDLHGMTLDQAHPALVRFLMNAQARDRRLVLVITGKGKQAQDDGPIPAQRGLLKTQVPQWLRMAPLNAVVLQVAEAHMRHGGAGALYVYLRRRR